MLTGWLPTVTVAKGPATILSTTCPPRTSFSGPNQVFALSSSQTSVV